MIWLRRILFLIAIAPSLVVAGLAWEAYTGGCSAFDLETGCRSEALVAFWSLALHVLTIPILITWLIVWIYLRIVEYYSGRQNDKIAAGR